MKSVYLVWLALPLMHETVVVAVTETEADARAYIAEEERRFVSSRGLLMVDKRTVWRREIERADDI